MNCFFCCKILPKEEISFPSGDLEQNINYSENSSTGLTDSDSSTLINVQNQQNILQISNYLNIPKSVFETERQLGTLDNVIGCCENCEEISGKLGELCSLLEITQMKINHQLNLLTNQISKKDGYHDPQQVVLSSFQEIFHQKCITKLSKIDSNPALQLTKCDLSPVQSDTQVYVEEQDNYDDLNVNQVDNEYKPVIEKPQIFAMANESHYICDFCPLTFKNLGNKKRHMLGSHTTQKKPTGHLIKPCEYCGGMFSTSYLNIHRKNIHGIGQGNEPSIPKVRKFERCGCGAIVRDVNMKVHKIVCQKGFCERVENKGNKCVQRGKPPPVKCNICDKLICLQNINYHKKRVHGIVEERVGRDSGKETKKKKCKYCDELISSQNLSRHVNRKHADKIVWNISQNEVINIQDGQMNEFEGVEESVLNFESFPEVRADSVMIMEDGGDVGLSIEDDPLNFG